MLLLFMNPQSSAAASRPPPPSTSSLRVRVQTPECLKIDAGGSSNDDDGDREEKQKIQNKRPDQYLSRKQIKLKFKRFHLFSTY